MFESIGKVCFVPPPYFSKPFYKALPNSVEHAKNSLMNFNCSSLDMTASGTQAQALEMSNETSQVDAAALHIALKFIYLGFIEHQQQVCSEHLMSLVALADFYGIASLALACKTLLTDYLAALTPDSATEVLHFFACLVSYT